MYAVYFLLPPLWQETYHWSTIMIAVRFLPIGVGAGVVGTFAGSLPNYFPVKWILLTGCFLAATGTVLLPFASTESRYWPFIFPALWLGSIGTMLVFSNTKFVLFYGFHLAR
jgi:predicted MFS family arabinose efflux permease